MHINSAKTYARAFTANTQLHEAAGSCRKLQEAAGSCRKLQEAAGSCRKLQEIMKINLPLKSPKESLEHSLWELDMVLSD
ncbi:hypothetical protein EAP58_18025 [Salmonella enterica]|nr:hypothetical protein [Salmonella enterica]